MELLSHNLLLLGVGGGACQVIAATVRHHGEPLRALGLDTDAFAIRGIDNVRCMLLGGTRLDGQGTAGDIVKGGLAAEDDLAGISNALENVRTAIVVTTLGGGTGGGVTPVLLRHLADLGIVTLCYAVLPFEFEGRDRMDAARRALALIEPHANTLVTIAQEDLLGDVALDDATLDDVFTVGARVLAENLAFLWRVLLAPGYIRFDPERLRTLLLEGGAAHNLFGEGEGAGRVDRVAGNLLNGPLALRAKDRLPDVQSVVLGVLAGKDLRLVEISDIVARVRAVVSKRCRIEVGTVIHDSYEGRLTVILLAFDPLARAKPEPALINPAADKTDAPALPAGKSSPRGKKPANKLRPTPAGRFQSVEQTFINGENFDIPTFVRKNIVIER